ncbi:hypothetical protein [Aestuariibaculum sediminum]|uniref:Uncharacterized protein n=1 Tax=Aestuariibaculum sediminum TaxID=2770637 RepID=A0A8J6QB61_9FLAO|nr:hypothetical protein [Aestuariibaculum sediminum]MBD0832656.1 hypothetical protein [Aestuariibaculum sediminum]
MQQLKIHKALKIVALLLAIALLTPTINKFAHLFAHHHHDICKGEKTTHLHELNLDCDFYKYKVFHNYTFHFFKYNIFLIKEESIQIVSQYQFLSEYQRLQTALRGPPSLI